MAIEDTKKHLKFNEKLIEEQKVTQEEQDAMVPLYEKLEEILLESKQETCSKERVQEIGKEVEAIEFGLQKLWHFPEDANYHRYWKYVGGCNCPNDNFDWMYYGQGKILRQDCIVHGWDETN